MLITAVVLLMLDARPALLLFLVLLLAAATPLVLGWMALLPAEREPFTRPGEPRAKKTRDGFAIFLLANISVSLLLRVPGFDAHPLSSKIVRLLPPDWAENALMIVFIWFGFIPGLAAAYSAVRANPIRLQLLAGGVLTLVLWFVGPWLLGAIAAAS
jgi:hypothetical protein